MDKPEKHQKSVCIDNQVLSLVLNMVLTNLGEKNTG